MTSAQDGRPDPADEQSAAQAPTVSTAPAHAPRWWSSVPSHFGRARTSTLILSLLFVALGTLYLNVRPNAPVVPTTGASVNQPARTVPTATPTRRSTAPATSSAQASTSGASPTSSGAARFTSAPSTSTSSPAAPTTSAPPTTVPTAVPTGGTSAAPTS